MGLVAGRKAEYTLRYWKASLAWKNIGDWAVGWNFGAFIDELREICNDNDRLGALADRLLDDVVYDKERNPLEIPGQVVSLHNRTIFAGQSTSIATQEAGVKHAAVQS
jgi:hypothetical protein